MSFDLEDLGWTRPPPGNLVAFLAAGLALRRMHQRAQRGDDDEPLIRDDDAPAVAPASSPRAENAPEDAARNRTRESLAARLGATDVPIAGAHLHVVRPGRLARQQARVRDADKAVARHSDAPARRFYDRFCTS